MTNKRKEIAMARQKKKGSQSETVKSIAMATAILTLIRSLIDLLKLLIELVIKLLE